MNILAGVMGILIIVTGAWYIYARDHLLERAQQGGVTVTRELCTAQHNGSYTCPAASIMPFSDIAVMDTASQAVCVLSFDGTVFTFTGAKKVTTPVGVLAASFHPDGALATLVQTGAETISLTLDATGRPVFLLRVGADFNREQCLSVSQ